MSHHQSTAEVIQRWLDGGRGLSSEFHPKDYRMKCTFPGLEGELQHLNLTNIHDACNYTSCDTVKLNSTCAIHR